MNAFIQDMVKIIKGLTKSNIYLVGAFPMNLLLKRDTYEVEILLQDDVRRMALDFTNLSKGILITADHNKAVVEISKEGKNLNLIFYCIQDTSIEKFLNKRDFTIEALAIKIDEDGYIHNQIIDFHKGTEDIKKKLIRFIEPDTLSIKPVNMLKAVRLMAELEFNLEEHTAGRIIRNAQILEKVAPEEISYELFKILKCKRTHYYFNIMDKQLHILNIIFPEIEPMKEVGKCKYHVVDSWAHSLYTLDVVESIIYADGYFENYLRRAYEEHIIQILCHGHRRLEIIKLAALFHDIGKPAAKKIDESGRVRFKGHEIAGMEIVEQIAERLKFCDKEKHFLCKLVKEHMWPLTLYRKNDVSGRAIYDLFRNFGEDTLDVLLVSLADIIATRKLLNPHEEMGMYKIHIEYLANNYLTRFKNIIDISHVIEENDIINNFAITDRHDIQYFIETVRKAIFFGKIPPEKKRAIKFLREEIMTAL